MSDQERESAINSRYVITYEDGPHKYWIDGEEVASVTQILEKTEAKPALPWWGMRVGMAAIIHAMGSSSWAELANANTYREILAGKPEPGREFFTRNDKKRKKPKTLVEALCIDNRLSTNHVKEDAGDRGTAIHDAMEALGAGVMPDIDDFPVEFHGYIEGLMRWWLDHEPDFVHQEVIVGSKELRYAGRFDKVLTYNKGPHQDKLILSDLKTSKAVYLSHLVQLDGYEVGWVEMGAGPLFDAKHVLNVPGDGSYQIVESKLERGTFRKRAELYHQIVADEKAHPEFKSR